VIGQYVDQTVVSGVDQKVCLSSPYEAYKRGYIRVVHGNPGAAEQLKLVN